MGQVIVIREPDDRARRLRLRWGQSLAAYMDANSLNRKQLIQRLADEHGIKVSRQAVDQWLKGDTAPRPHVQAALGAIFKAPPHSIFPLEAA